MKLKKAPSKRLKPLISDAETQKILNGPSFLTKSSNLTKVYPKVSKNKPINYKGLKVTHKPHRKIPSKKPFTLPHKIHKFDLNNFDNYKKEILNFQKEKSRKSNLKIGPNFLKGLFIKTEQSSQNK